MLTIKILKIKGSFLYKTHPRLQKRKFLYLILFFSQQKSSLLIRDEILDSRRTFRVRRVSTHNSSSRRKRIYLLLVQLVAGRLQPHRLFPSRFSSQVYFITRSARPDEMYKFIYLFIGRNFIFSTRTYREHQPVSGARNLLRYYLYRDIHIRFSRRISFSRMRTLFFWKKKERE